MKKIKNKLFYFVAGEASGDLHASCLMQEISRCERGVLFRGIGGPKMERFGLRSICNFNKLNIMGFVEIFKHLSFFFKLKNKTIKDIVKTNPDQIILVDYPGFNLRLAKAIKKITSIPIVYYISPQVWAWKESRIKTINKYIDHMVVVFPFEVDWFSQRKIKVSYFGHPLLDLYKKSVGVETNKKNVTVGLFPGSRPQEINKHVPILKSVVLGLKSKVKNITFVVGVVDNRYKLLYQKLGLKPKECETIINNSFVAFDKSDFAIVASGTATLECAITNTPFVVIYKTSYISWIITSVYLKVRYASIVNILANKQLVEECLQKNCNADYILNKLLQLINTKQDSLKSELNSVVGSLGGGQAYQKTARFILNQ